MRCFAPVLASLLAAPLAASAQASTLDGARLAISVGADAHRETYVVLGALPAAIATPPTARYENLDSWIVIRPFDDAALDDEARGALGLDWTAYTNAGETCSGKLDAPVVIELVERISWSDGTAIVPGPDGELDAEPYERVLAARLDATCADAAEIALPDGVAPAVLLRGGSPSTAGRDDAIAFVEALPEDVEAAATYRRAARSAGIAPDVVESDIATWAQYVEDRSTGEHGWIVHRAFGLGCGDGYSTHWTLVETGAGGALRIRAAGDDFVAPSMILDLGGDGALEVVVEGNLRRLDAPEVALSVNRRPWGCPC